MPATRAVRGRVYPKMGGVDFWVRKEKEIRIEREISLLKKTLEVFSKLSELYLNEMASMGQSWPEVGQNWAKMGQIGPNRAKLGQKGPKWDLSTPLAQESARVGPRNLAPPPNK